MLVVGLLSSTANSASAAGWLQPKDISAANEVVDGRPQVAVDAAGNAVAIWERHVGGEEIVEASERPAGGDWSEPETLSLPDEEGEQSRVAIDAAGNAIAVWITGTSITDYVIRSAARPPGGAWSDPEDVSGPVSEAVTPNIALAAAGDTVVVWSAFEGEDRILQGAVRSADGEWSAPEDLSDAGDDVALLDEPDVAIDAAGNAIAVWGVEAATDIVQASVRPADGEWGEPEDLSDAGQNGGEPGVTMNETGAAIAVWARFDGSDDIVQASVRPVDGEWGEPDDLSEAGQDAAEPAVAMDDAGAAIAVWARFNGSNSIVQAAARPSTGDWSEPEDLSAAGRNASSPVLAANEAVGAVTIWSRPDGAHQRVQAVVCPPGEQCSKPDTLSAAGENAGFAEVALDAAGNAIAVFGRSGDDGPFAQATGYDFAAPRLNDLRMPTEGTVGEPVSFSVSPFDVFPLGATTWAFGDGSQASGNAVSHVYEAPGAYPVTVSAVDAGGNASTQIGAIAIAAAPTPPPRQLALALRIERKSLRKLRRTATLRVAVSVNEAARVALSGRARLGGGGGDMAHASMLVPVFVPKTVRLAAAVDGKVTLALSKRGRNALRSLSRVRILITGRARNDAGDTTAKTAARTLR